MVGRSILVKVQTVIIFACFVLFWVKTKIACPQICFIALGYKFLFSNHFEFVWSVRFLHSEKLGGIKNNKTSWCFSFGKRSEFWNSRKYSDIRFGFLRENLKKGLTCPLGANHRDRSLNCWSWSLSFVKTFYQ